MKTIITFTILLFFSLNTYSQEPGIINDADGFVNIHKEPISSSLIIGKIYTNDIFYFETNKTDWYAVYHDEHIEDKKESSITGFVHKSRIRPLQEISHLSKRKIFRDSCVLYNDSVRIVVARIPFNFKKYIVKRDKAGFVTSINTKYAWGTDGNLPKQAIKSVKTYISNRPVVLPGNAYSDLFEPNLNNVQCYIIKPGLMYIEMINSDGAGAYSVYWVIKDNNYLKRQLLQF